MISAPAPTTHSGVNGERHDLIVAVVLEILMQALA
jgi:hypothetical protein